MQKNEKPHKTFCCGISKLKMVSMGRIHETQDEFPGAEDDIHKLEDDVYKTKDDVQRAKDGGNKTRASSHMSEANIS